MSRYRRIKLRHKEQKMFQMSSKTIVLVLTIVICISMFGVRSAQGYNRIVGQEYEVLAEPFCRTNTSIIENVFGYTMGKYEWISGENATLYPYDTLGLNVTEVIYPERQIEDIGFDRYNPTDDGLMINIMNGEFENVETSELEYGVMNSIHVMLNITPEQIMAHPQVYLEYDISNQSLNYLDMKSVVWYWQKPVVLPEERQYNVTEETRLTAAQCDYFIHLGDEANWWAHENYNGSYKIEKALGNTGSIDLMYNKETNYDITKIRNNYGAGLYLVMAMNVKLYPVFENGDMFIVQDEIVNILVDLNLKGVEGDYVWAMTTAIPTMGVVSGLVLLGGAGIVVYNTPSYSSRKLYSNSSVVRPVRVGSVPNDRVLQDMAYDQIRRGGF